MGNIDSLQVAQRPQKLLQTAKQTSLSKRDLKKPKGSISHEDDTDKGLDKVDLAARVINPAEYAFPFENLVFKCGRLDSIAYCGVLEYLEVAGCLDNLKRVCGTGHGAMVAMLMCIGYTWQEILTILSEDVTSIVKGGIFGGVSFLPNMMKSYGVSSVGEDLYNKMGKWLNNKCNTDDLTFKQIADKYNKELCIVVTNINQMKTEYFHVKTTPHLSVKSAVQMALTIPGVYIPRQEKINDNDCIYVDGGLLCSYPIHCFDGWYLSLKREDMLSRRLTVQPEHSTDTLACNKNTDKTLGILLYSEAEENSMKTKLESRLGVLIPVKPSEETPLYQSCKVAEKDMKDLESSYAVTHQAVDQFMKILEKLPSDAVDKKDLKGLFTPTLFPVEDVEALFGREDIEMVFESLDYQRNGMVAVKDLMETVEQKALSIYRQYQKLKQHHINNYTSFMLAMNATVTERNNDIQLQKDVDRSIGINTGHININDKDLTPSDRQFLTDRGYNSARAFLQYFVVKSKPPKKIVSQNIPEEAS